MRLVHGEMAFARVKIETKMMYKRPTVRHKIAASCIIIWWFAIKRQRRLTCPTGANTIQRF